MQVCRGTALPVAGALRSSSPHHKLKWFRLLLPLHELNRFMIMTMMTRADATAVGPRRIATSTAKVSLVSSILLCCSGMMILGMITPVTAAPLRLLRRQRQTWSTSTTNSSNAAAHPSGGLLLLETRNDDGCPTPDFSFSMAASPYPTSFPVETSVPQEPAESQLLSWLTSETTPESVLLNPSTPQGQAYEWMLTSPTLASMTERRAQQVFALATLYFATGGATWTNNLGWLRFDNECEWAKVYCEAGDVDPTVLFTVNNDTFLAVKALHLGQNNMTDEIPPQLYLLDELVEFNIFDNALEGTLPSQIGNWTRLQVFDVEGNNLTGDPWTPLLFRWTDLTVIRLSNNAWNVPDQKFNDHITDWVTLGSVGSLRVLDVANAGWQGSVPEEIGNFSSLVELKLSDNALTGELPKVSLNGLAILRLNNNALEGSIPNELMSSPDLRILHLEDNLFTGSFPVFQSESLQDIRLDRNKLTGALPVTLGGGNGTMKILGLSENSFSGSIPDVISQLPLQVLDLTSNRLTGTIPRGLFELTSLSLLYLSNNLLTGSIPTTLGLASSLRDLYADNNQLKGRIPVIASGQLANLTELLLQGNKLSGTVPNSICNLVNSSVLEDFWTDCAAIGDAPAAMNCTCCTQCHSFDVAVYSFSEFESTVSSSLLS